MELPEPVEWPSSGSRKRLRGSTDDPGWAITGNPDIVPGRPGALTFHIPDGTPVPHNALRDPTDTLEALAASDGLGNVDVEGRAATSYDPLTHDAASDIIGWWLAN